MIFKGPSNSNHSMFLWFCDMNQFSPGCMKQSVLLLPEPKWHCNFLPKHAFSTSYRLKGVRKEGEENAGRSSDKRSWAVQDLFSLKVVASCTSTVHPHEKSTSVLSTVAFQTVEDSYWFPVLHLYPDWRSPATQASTFKSCAVALRHHSGPLWSLSGLSVSFLYCIKSPNLDQL